MPLVDFADLKRLAPMRDVLRLLGWAPISVQGGEQRGPCPIHRSTRPRSRSFAVAGDGFFCHSCKANGDQVRLYATVRAVSVYEAAHQLAAALGFAVPYQRPPAPWRKTRNGEEER